MASSRAELTAGLKKAREIGDIVEMWRCAVELTAMDRRRCVLADAAAHIDSLGLHPPK
jgi:hypothetical protein